MRTWLLGLGLAVTALVLVHTQVAQAAFDGFSQGTAAYTTWDFSNPLDDASYTFDAVMNHLQVSVPSDVSHDCWDTTANCVRYLMPIDNADNATFETKIDGGNLPDAYQAYGIMLWQDDENYIRFDAWSDGQPQLTGWQVVNGVGSNLFWGHTVDATQTLYLRLVKSGKDYTAYYSTDGESWAETGSFENSLEPVDAGVAVANAYTSSSTGQPILANFDYFSALGGDDPLPGPIQKLESSSVTKTAISWRWDTPVGEPDDTYLCSLDSATAESCGTSTPLTYTASPLTCGTTHTLQVWAVDGNGTGDPVPHTQQTVACDQLYDYNDVVVIVNDASTISGQIGNYFVNARSIPTWNVANINTSTDEEITPTVFSGTNGIEPQMINFLSGHGLTDSTNYLVTTKGMPLKIRDPLENEGCYHGNNYITTCASVESELALITSPTLSGEIGGSGPQSNPYLYIYSGTNHFTHSAYSDTYLVTRLDGWTYGDITALIGRSAKPAEVHGSTVHYVFDQELELSSALNAYMQKASCMLHDEASCPEHNGDLGYQSTLNADPSYLHNETDVLGYNSFGEHDNYAHTGPLYWVPNFTWHVGALGSFNSSYSAYTLNEADIIETQSMIGELVHEGITGVHGTVYEPSSAGMSFDDVVYGNQAKGFNLAENFSKGTLTLSWMGVMVGDPKETLAVTANVKVQLEGPYNTSTHAMDTTLLSGSYIPLSQPYSGSPWSYSGTESVESVPSGIVDWVLLELRTGTGSGTAVARRAAFLKSDGTIVDTDGLTRVSFPSVTPGNYYVVVYQRNHLAVMSASAIALSPSSALYDFTTAQNKAYGTTPMTQVESGVFAMYSGDANASGVVTTADSNIIYADLLDSGYLPGDVNLSGVVSTADANVVFTNLLVGSQVP